MRNFELSSSIAWVCPCGLANLKTSPVCRCGRKKAGNGPRTAEVTPAPVSGGVREKNAAKWQQTPNGMESEYRREFLEPRLRPDDLLEVWYEPITIRLECQHDYTPDWVGLRADYTLECHECKGPHIYSRDSRILHDQAAVECRPWPFFWAQKKDGQWKIHLSPKRGAR
jgi:hypothetical protein